MTPRGYADTFDKSIGNIRVLSFGGGSPRWVRIFRTDVQNMSIENLTVEEARDLHYSLGRFLNDHGDIQ